MKSFNLVTIIPFDRGHVSQDFKHALSKYTFISKPSILFLRVRFYFKGQVY